MVKKIKIKRGLKKDLPTLDLGEYGLTTDESKVYIGGTDGNVGLVTDKELTQVNTNLTTQLAQTATKGEVRESTSTKPINVSEMDTETKQLFTGGAVAVVGTNAVGRENVKPKAIDGSKTTFMTKTQNLFDGTYYDLQLEFATGVGLRYKTISTNNHKAAIIPILPNETYTIKVHETALSNDFKVAIVNSDVDFNSSTYINTDTTIRNSNTAVVQTFTNTADGKFLLIGVSDVGNMPKLQVEKGNVATSYVEPFLMKEQFIDPSLLSRANEWKKLSDVIFIENLSKNYVVGSINPSTGNLVTSEDAIRTTGDFIKINPSEQYVYGVGKFDIAVGTRSVRFSYYSEANSFISATSYIAIEENKFYPLSIPSTASSMKVSVSKEAANTFYLNIGTTPYHDNEGKVYKSGVNEILPEKVIEPKHLSVDVIKMFNKQDGGSPTTPTVLRQQNPYPGKLNFQTIKDNDYLRIYYLSQDGKALYAGRISQAMQSLDEGVTWQSIAGAMPNGQQVMAIRELNDGELLFTTKTSPAQNMRSKIYKTVGYKRDNLTGVTVKEVHEAKGINADFNNAWGLDVYENIVVASEYGLQGLEGARHAFISTDYGETWREIFDQNSTILSINGAPAYTSNAHVHTIHYDRYGERIWLAVGDQENCATYYSDDLGYTWKLVKDSAGMYAVQYTGIVSYPEGVFFGTDRVPEGVHFWERTKNKTDDVYIKPFFETYRGTNRTLVYGYPFRRYAEKDEVTYFSAGRDIAVDGVLGDIIVGFKGVHGAAILYDFTDQLHLQGISCVGKTEKGNVFASIKNNTTGYYHLLKAKAPVWE